MGKKFSILSVPVFVLSIFLLFPTGTSAHDMPYYWPNGDKVGSPCSTGLTSGNYVKAVQANVTYANGNFISYDGYYGPETYNAVLNYQSSYSDLSNDGCVGPATWGKMYQELSLQWWDADYGREHFYYLDYAQVQYTYYRTSSRYHWRLRYNYSDLHEIIEHGWSQISKS